jgi:hypothetical protein
MSPSVYNTGAHEKEEETSRLLNSSAKIKVSNSDICNGLLPPIL